MVSGTRPLRSIVGARLVFAQGEALAPPLNSRWPVSAELSSDYGRTGILVNSTGIVTYWPVAECSDEEWQRVLSENRKARGSRPGSRSSLRQLATQTKLQDFRHQTRSMHTPAVSYKRHRLSCRDNCRRDLAVVSAPAKSAECRRNRACWFPPRRSAV